MVPFLSLPFFSDDIQYSTQYVKDGEMEEKGM